MVWHWKWCYDFLISLPHFLEKQFAPDEHYKVLSFWLLSRSKNTKCTTLWWLTLFFRSFSTLKRMMIVLLEIQWYLYCLQTWHTFEMHYYLVSTISKAIKKCYICDGIDIESWKCTKSFISLYAEFYFFGRKMVQNKIVSQYFRFLIIKVFPNLKSFKFTKSKIFFQWVLFWDRTKW